MSVEHDRSNKQKQAAHSYIIYQYNIIVSSKLEEDTLVKIPILAVGIFFIIYGTPVLIDASYTFFNEGYPRTFSSSSNNLETPSAPIFALISGMLLSLYGIAYLGFTRERRTLTTAMVVFGTGIAASIAITDPTNSLATTNVVLVGLISSIIMSDVWVMAIVRDLASSRYSTMRLYALAGVSISVIIAGAGMMGAAVATKAAEVETLVERVEIEMSEAKATGSIENLISASENLIKVMTPEVMPLQIIGLMWIALFTPLLGSAIYVARDAQSNFRKNCLP